MILQVFCNSINSKVFWKKKKEKKVKNDNSLTLSGTYQRLQFRTSRKSNFDCHSSTEKPLLGFKLKVNTLILWLNIAGICIWQKSVKERLYGIKTTVSVHMLFITLPRSSPQMESGDSESTGFLF